MLVGIALLAAISLAQSKPASLTKLGIIDKKVGTGPVVAAGDRVFITYIGTLKSGTIFDSNVSGNANPLSYIAGEVPRSLIEGMNQGVIGMRVGGFRRLEIPAALAYGDQAQAKIPANSDLVFEITLWDVVKKGEENIYDFDDIKPGSGAPVKKGDTITVAYTGKLVNGKLIDSTYVTGRKPVEFKVGVGRALRGIDAGLIGMKRGGKRRLKLPPNLAYGASGNGFIPPHNIVIYEIELLKIKRA